MNILASDVSYSFCVKMTFSGKPRTAANLESKMMNCFLVTGFGFLRQQWVTGAQKDWCKTQLRTGYLQADLAIASVSHEGEC
jgi:hypothetical protein